MLTSSDSDVKRTIAGILGVENSAAWDIVDSNPEDNLYMVHHKPEADTTQYGQIRGITVDTQAGAIVSRSFGYTPRVVTDQLTIQPDNNMHLVDDLGYEHVVDPNRVSIKMGFEGTIINVFKHNGHVYRSTRKKLDPSNSRWGSSETFADMYWSLDGPTDEELFDNNSDYSPYCHIFIMVHPDVQVVSKDNIGSGFLVYLGPKQMWSLDYYECPYKQLQIDGSTFEGITEEEFAQDPRPYAGWIDDTLYVPADIQDMYSAETRNVDKTIYSAPSLSMMDANRHLIFGFYNQFPGSELLDRRLLPGEFVVLYLTDETGQTTGMIRVESQAYAWRSDMRDNDPNLRHRFYQLLNGSYIRYDTHEGKRRFESLYPSMTPYDKDSIQARIAEYGPFTVWPQMPDFDDSVLYNKQGRLNNIWMAFLSAVPLHKQLEVSGYLDELINRRNELVGWLQMLEGQKLDKAEFSRRVLNILSAAKSFAIRQANSGFRDRRGRKLSVKELTSNNIQNLISKEEGSSLYRLVKEMIRWKKEQEENKLE